MFIVLRVLEKGKLGLNTVGKGKWREEGLSLTASLRVGPGCALVLSVVLCPFTESAHYAMLTQVLLVTLSKLIKKIKQSFVGELNYY